MAKSPKGGSPDRKNGRAQGAGGSGPKGHEAKPAAFAAAGAVPEPTGLTDIGAPALAPFWVEWGRVVAQKWPMPVFVLSLICGGLVLALRPRTEPVRSAQEYMEIARTAFKVAVAAQDERRDSARALEFLAGQNIKELAVEVSKNEAADPFGVHGVLPSCERAMSQDGEMLSSEDLAMLGEACFRLATIKRESPEILGRRVVRSAEELYRIAIARLGDAWTAAASAVGGPAWRARRCVIAECHAQLGEYDQALAELASLLEDMTAAQAESLRAEKDPDSAGRVPGGCAPAEWARAYELVGRCYDCKGNKAEAATYYRLFLEQGASGQIAHAARLRLANLIMDELTATRDRSRIGARIEEVCRLCHQVEQSDAPAAVREQAAFLLGRGAYQLGCLESNPAKARAHYREAVAAFQYPFSPIGSYLDMSRVLLARSLWLSGREKDADEMLVGMLRLGEAGKPAIFACAAISRADIFAERNPQEALKGTATPDGYLSVISTIRKISQVEKGALVPELSELLDDLHLVVADPTPDSEKPLPAGGAQLLRIARTWSAEHKYDEAAAVYQHIINNYPSVETDRYYYLLGELLNDKAERMTRQGKPEKDVRPVILEAARAFMSACLAKRSGPVRNDKSSSIFTNSWWQAGRCYYRAGRYDGAAGAFREFSERFGDDGRAAEALYYRGDSLRRMGDFEKALATFSQGANEHPTTQYGYLCELAKGEVCLEMGRLEAERDDKKSANAKAVFESIRIDSRFTPDSQVWMKSLFRLGETYYRLGGVRLAEAGELEAGGKDGAAEKRSQAVKFFQDAIDTLEEARERYPIEKFSNGQRPSFLSFIRERRLPVMRMLAMSRFELGQFDKAAAGFDDILKVASEVMAFDSAEAEEHRRMVADYRRLAHAYKGISQVNWAGRGKDQAESRQRYQMAAETFDRGYDDFPLPAEGGAWFADAAGMAWERAGDAAKAKDRFAKAIQGHTQMDKDKAVNGAEQKPEKLARPGFPILPPRDWSVHSTRALEGI